MHCGYKAYPKDNKYIKYSIYPTARPTTKTTTQQPGNTEDCGTGINSSLKIELCIGSFYYKVIYMYKDIADKFYKIE